MIPSNELFALIKSLSRTEKRYFKIYAAALSGKEQSIYINLFDSIEKQNQYDEQLLKEKFKNEKFVRQFSVAKNYLQHIIIKSLNSYYATLSVNMILNELLQSIEVMYKKGHYSICLKLAKKGKKLSEKYEKYAFLDLFLEWESRVHFSLSKFDEVRNILHKQQANLLKIQNELSAKIVAFEMYEKTAEFGFVATKEQLNLLDNVLKKARGLNIRKESGIISQYYHYSAWLMYYCCTDNYSKRFEYSEKILSLLESNSHIIEENPGIYISSLKNYCGSLISFGDLKKALKIARKLRQLHLLYDISRWENERNLAQLLSYDIEIIAFILMGKADKAIGLESEIEALFKLHKLNTNKSNLFELIYNLALAFFAKGSYEKCLSWIFKILNERDLNYREDLYIASRLLALIAHYELKNTILLNNLITSTQRFLKIRKRLHATESAYLHFLKLCNKHDDKEKQRADLIALKKEIEKYSDDSDELKMINNIFLMPWIKHKLTGKSVAAIVAEDYKNYTGKKK